MRWRPRRKPSQVVLPTTSEKVPAVLESIRTRIEDAPVPVVTVESLLILITTVVGS